jgi:hypothetical protein
MVYYHLFDVQKCYFVITASCAIMYILFVDHLMRDSECGAGIHKFKKKTWEPPQKYSCQKDDIKQVSYGGPTNVTHRLQYLVSLAPRTFAFLIKYQTSE